MKSRFDSGAQWFCLYITQEMAADVANALGEWHAHHLPILFRSKKRESLFCWRSYDREKLAKQSPNKIEKR
eukprot:g3485.t1